ncbi:Aste57867_19750 [Aphanomyces stellatus]|uniref:Aste57867_19750 protein n=1 Tax=Aphanomyces stellatus TaxID=120398 RepID=A0A485LEH4_9STRA|nr:hypothetical protein As57867_019685 [Aphanomyces stellatus]VFT96448.1 Aste57867_19750 [Aphanomyces stellatus]
MAKVHVHQAAAAPAPSNLQRPVRIGKLALFYVCLFTLNLITIPLKAYLSEPLPWTLRQPALNLTLTMSFDGYVNSTYQYFTAKYNNQTLAPTTAFFRNSSDNSMLLRTTLSLPSNDVVNCNKYLFQFPGAVFYSRGMVRFVCSFLAQKAATQHASVPAYMCQHNKLLGISLAEACTWIELASHVGNNSFTVYHVTQLLENATWSWIKFGMRCALACYIVWFLWQHVDHDYRPLLRNLPTIGLGENPAANCSSYVVHVGDPTWLILSHPFVTAFMVIDCAYCAPYSAIAVNRVSQVSNIEEFLLGSLYGSRLVWASYGTMRYFSSRIKRFNLEEYFAPMDSGLLALIVSFYSGPFIYMIVHSPVILIFQWQQQVFVPSTKQLIETEGILGAITFLLMFGILPLIQSWTACYIRRCRTKSATLVVGEPSRYASVQFNDWKHRAMLIHHGRIPTTHLSGGTMYALFDEDPKYRKLQLFSTRGSDCFVSCLDQNGVLTRHVRLSLLCALDFQTSSAGAAILTCPQHHANTVVCRIDDHMCGILNLSPQLNYCVHRSAANSRWLL